MEPKTYRQKLARIHFAMGHARRLKLLEILEDTPEGLTFEDLAYRSSINASTLDHHMKILNQAGFLTKQIKGPYSIYRYRGAPLSEITQAQPLKSVVFTSIRAAA